MGETETATISRGWDTTLSKMWSSPHPRSLGYAYQAVATWAGMSGTEREGKLMGLAAHGSPTQVDLLRRALISRVDEDGFVIAPELLEARADMATWVAHCERALGPRRRHGDELKPYHLDIAASLQVLTEQLLLDLLVLARDKTGRRLARSLGVCS